MIRIAPIAVLGVMAIGPSALGAGALSLSNEDRKQLADYARDTWRSVDALASIGPLPADALWRAGGTWSHTPYTSPTNIAAYLWSTIAAEGLGLIDRAESGRRLASTLAAVGRLERSNGFFFNWYDPRTGDRVRVWPGGAPIRPFLSTVDNGWLAAGLMMVGRVRPELRVQAEALLNPMNFGFFYDPHDPADPINHPGLLRGGYWTEGGGEYADYHYGVLNTEPRIASYIGIARGDLPPDHYFRMCRSATDPSVPTRPCRGVAVAEGSRRYRGAKVVPSWDGTMFEALMVPLFVPEGTWSPGSWGENHRIYTEAQIEYGLKDARLGFWGISASADGRNGYHAFGVEALGLSPNAGKGPAGGHARVVTPHASFLALPFAPREAMDNLRNLSRAFPIYSPYGFLDAVDVGTGQVSEAVLVLDQGMILASIANALRDGMLHQAFAVGAIEAAIRPILAAEQFEVNSMNPSCPPGMMMDDSVPSNSSPASSRSSRPIAAALRRVAKLGARSVEESPLPFAAADRTDSLGTRPSPARRRGGRSTDKRRAIA